MLKIVRLPIDDRSNVKVFRERRRIRFPFESGGRPRVGPSDAAVLDGPSQVNHRQKIAEGQNRSSRGGHDVKRLKLRWITVVTARHAEIAQNKLREKREIESHEEHHGGQTGQD